MSYLDDQLEPGERITYKAQVSRLAYIWAIALLLGLMMVGQLSGLAGTQLALTDRRLIGKTGFLGRKSITLTHKNIESVHVRQGVLGSLFGYGTVTVTSKTGAKTVFKGITYPLEFQQLTDEAVEMAVLGRKLSQTVMPKW